MDSATQGVLEVARSVLERLDVDAVLERVLEAARELTGAQYAALGVLDPSRTRLERFLTVGVDEDARRRIGPPPTGRGVLGELIRDPRPLRVGDVGSHPYSYGFPVGHPPMSSFLGVPVLVAGAPYGNLYLTEKAGGEFTEEDEQAVILLADFAGLAIDHARRFTSSETERAQLERTVSALDATIQISRALGGETDLQSILELVAKRGRALVSARVVLIELLEGQELVVAAGAGELPEGLIGRPVPLHQSVAGVALDSRQTQSLSDHLNRRRFDEHGAGMLGVEGEDGLVAPLVFRERPYGALIALGCLTSEGFNDEHRRLLEAFASSAATAVATAQSAADERRRQRVAAAEAERGRWARELHDETLQALGNLRLVLGGAQRRGDPDALASAVAQAVEQLDLDISSLRSLITELRPAALDQLGLQPALLALLERIGHGGIEMDADVDLAYERQEAATRLTPELETGIYRIVQEALTNAVKHGAAKAARVRVIEEDGQVRVRIDDDGSGFDTSAQTSGFGLAGMNERTELLDGRLTVASSPGEGTSITATFPVRRRPPEEGSLSSAASTAWAP